MSLSSEMVNGLFAVSGAVIGAIIAGLFALYVARSTKEKKEIVVSTSHSSRLLVVDDQIASDVEIRVSGNKVDNVILSEIFLSNTGNRAVEGISFPVSCQSTAQIISIDALDQATDAPRSGSGIAKNSGQEFDVNIDYINPGEEIKLRCIVSGEEPEWSVALRQPELIVIRRDRPVASFSDVILEAALESTPLFGAHIRTVYPLFTKISKKR